MKLLNKIKGWLMEPVVTEYTVTPRAARLQGAKVEEPKGFRLKGWVKSTLGTAPWAAVAAVLFFLVASGPTASGALVYGLMKAAFAIIGTVIADHTMFNGIAEAKESAWLPYIRRAMVFMGICWLMAVT